MRFPLSRAARMAAVAIASAVAFSCSETTTPLPPVGVQAITITPAQDTLTALSDTVHLSAVGLDVVGVVLPDAAFAWTSSDPTIATVGGATGIVTAMKNGSAIITATSNAKAATATIVVRQRAASVEQLSGQNQGATVGFALDTALSVRARDAGGSLAAGVALAFMPAGNGSATPPVSTTNNAGEATAKWTLGTTQGLQQLNVVAVEDTAVHVTIDATAFAGEPDTMFAVGGTNQQELPSRALPFPLAVKVIDAHGNPIADIPITFAVKTGGGTLDTTDVLTGLDGIASVQWTLGAALGAQTVDAILPDSAVGAIVDLPGSPVTFTATGVELSVTGVVATPVAGQEMIVQGSGFAPVLANNTVTVGGLTATVTAVTDAQTRLHVVVPSFGCTPAQARTVAVTRLGVTRSIATLVQPANPVALGIGEHAIVTDPASFCLQFLATGSGADEYLVGVTATRAINGDLQFVMQADDGVTVAPTISATPLSRVASSVSAAVTPDRERALRDWESAFFATRARTTRVPLAALVAPRNLAVGDMVALRVPGITTDPCNNFTTVNARVLAMGPRVTVATDATLPSDPVSTAAIAAALSGFLNTFGVQIYGVATTHFGVPGDLDADQRVMVLFSPAVTPSGLPTFTSAIDNVAPSVCAASNNGEVVYVAVPAAPAASELAATLASRLPQLARELGYLIQLSRRINAGGAPLPSWLAEAQATLSTEVAGLAMRGDAARADLGAAVVNADATAAQWYKPLFDNVSFLFGWDGSTGTVAGAPERCSVFGFRGLSTPCAGTFDRGAAWSFLRFVANHITATGGEAQFLASLIGNEPSGNATSVLEGLAGAPLDDLLVRWAMSLYVDGRVQGTAAPSLQLSSWNLADIFGARPASQQLVPPAFGFASFARPGIVVGGGTAYARVSASGAHGPLALRVVDGAGANVGSELRPRMWIVRLK